MAQPRTEQSLRAENLFLSDKQRWWSFSEILLGLWNYFPDDICSKAYEAGVTNNGRKYSPRTNLTGMESRNAKPLRYKIQMGRRGLIHRVLYELQRQGKIEHDGNKDAFKKKYRYVENVAATGPKVD